MDMNLFLFMHEHRKYFLLNLFPRSLSFCFLLFLPACGTTGHSRSFTDGEPKNSKMGKKSAPPSTIDQQTEKSPRYELHPAAKPATKTEKSLQRTPNLCPYMTISVQCRYIWWKRHLNHHAVSEMLQGIFSWYKLLWHMFLYAWTHWNKRSRSKAETESQNSPDKTVPGEKAEIIEDIKIDSLKTEIELTFTRTLLLELTQLKKRLPVKKENPSQTGAGDPAFSARTREGTSGDEHIEKRIAKLEAILYNLGKKIEADVSDLQTRLNSLKQSGFTGLLTDKGRIYRMLSSELKTKYTVLNSLQTRVPVSPFRYFSGHLLLHSSP